MENYELTKLLRAIKTARDRMYTFNYKNLAINPALNKKSAKFPLGTPPIAYMYLHVLLQSAEYICEH